MGYVSKNVAAEILGVPPKYLKKMGIIKQYHTAAIKEEASKHNLPIVDWPFTYIYADQGLYQALLDMDEFTRAIITEDTNKEFWDTCKERVFIFAIGPSQWCHKNFESMEEAANFCQKTINLSPLKKKTRTTKQSIS